MTSPAPTVRIWLETTHHTAFRVGGWAFVRADGGGLSGAAGGERRVDADAVALGGLVAALEGVAAGTVQVLTASAAVAAIPRRIAVAKDGEGEPPADNLALWAQAMAALERTGAKVSAVRAAEPASAFAASWAEVAQEKGKTGAFRSAIPKTNLAKLKL